MRAYHVTTSARYRSHFGAVRKGGTLVLGIDVADEALADEALLKQSAELEKSSEVEKNTDYALRCVSAASTIHPPAVSGLLCLYCEFEEQEPKLLHVPLKVLREDEKRPSELRAFGEPAFGEATHYFYAEVTLKHCGLVWYSFELTAPTAEVWRYGAREGWTTGEGAFSWEDPPKFQITVFEPRNNYPAWFHQAVCYQIFPDRFARGTDWETRVSTSLARTAEPPSPLRAAELGIDPTDAVVPRLRGGIARELVEDWDLPPRYLRAEHGDIQTWEFYGGTLLGITEHLDYLVDLGITMLYVNPIFEATSNHRYDTADYLHIDPMLGDAERFSELCQEAAKRGIAIILDGVFNHVGADSRYFNRHGNYAELGGYESIASPYHSWFDFFEDGTYRGWWGNQDLPDVNERAEAFQELICGEDGVVRTWLRAGASGWRLDVADELSDAFICRIKAAALAEKPDAILIGEVWEDASNKRAYNQLRHYFSGKELDSTMNYPLRALLLDLLLQRMSAAEMVLRLRELQQNYPADQFYGALNLLGSHDRERMFTVLGDAPNPDELSEETRATYRLSEEQEKRAAARFWLAAMLQLLLPGVPSIYYGDELGLEGFRDPYNRASFPWEGDRARAHVYCKAMYRQAIELRRSLPAFTAQNFEPFSQGDDVFGFWRWADQKKLGTAQAGHQLPASEIYPAQASINAASTSPEYVCVVVNVSTQATHTLEIPMYEGMVATELVSPRPLTLNGENTCSIELAPLSVAVVLYTPKQRLQQEMMPGLGVLCHITSLPNEQDPTRKGVLGPAAKRFVDWLAENNIRYWQVLPVNPTGEYGSPYAGLSAFAGNIHLLEGSAAELVQRARTHIATPEGATQYAAFMARQSYWITTYAVFCALKDRYLGIWQNWPERYRHFSPELLDDPELASGIELHCHLQFLFQEAWEELISYAHAHEVQIVGDIPMYVSSDSADVWSHPEFFSIDEYGNTLLQAGAPGDAFAPEGQLWGNPVFRWDELARDGYSWWFERLRRCFDLYDVLRLDHFIGFQSYFKVPVGIRASEGSYGFGPGYEFFRQCQKRFGNLPFIAEDLGQLTPAMRALRARTGLLGMDILQFVDYDPRLGYMSKPETIAYSGTHDNQTLVGWCAERFSLSVSEAHDVAKTLLRDLVQTARAQNSGLVILPLQDMVLLDNSARMNVPGVAEGNWEWQVSSDQLVPAAALLQEIQDCEL